MRTGCRSNAVASCVPVLIHSQRCAAELLFIAAVPEAGIGGATLHQQPATPVSIQQLLWNAFFLQYQCVFGNYCRRSAKAAAQLSAAALNNSSSGWYGLTQTHHWSVADRRHFN
jgi:hypothetical protein